MRTFGRQGRPDLLELRGEEKNKENKGATIKSHASWSFHFSILAVPSNESCERRPENLAEQLLNLIEKLVAGTVLIWQSMKVRTKVHNLVSVRPVDWPMRKTFRVRIPGFGKISPVGAHEI